LVLSINTDDIDVDEMKMEMAMVKRREDAGSTGQVSCRRLYQGLGLCVRLLPGVEHATATAAT
jgi:hypothetical protein